MNKYVCRFFLTGNCSDKSDCLFPHVHDSQRSPDTVCRYFLKGKCMYGKACKNDHVSFREGGSIMVLNRGQSKHRSQICKKEKERIVIPSNNGGCESRSSIDGDDQDNKESSKSIELENSELETEIMKSDDNFEKEKNYNPFNKYFDIFPCQEEKHEVNYSECFKTTSDLQASSGIPNKICFGIINNAHMPQRLDSNNNDNSSFYYRSENNSGDLKNSNIPLTFNVSNKALLKDSDCKSPLGEENYTDEEDKSSQINFKHSSKIMCGNFLKKHVHIPKVKPVWVYTGSYGQTLPEKVYNGQNLFEVEERELKLKDNENFVRTVYEKENSTILCKNIVKVSSVANVSQRNILLNKALSNTYCIFRGNHLRDCAINIDVASTSNDFYRTLLSGNYKSTSVQHLNLDLHEVDIKSPSLPCNHNLGACRVDSSIPFSSKVLYSDSLKIHFGYLILQQQRKDLYDKEISTNTWFYNAESGIIFKKTDFPSSCNQLSMVQNFNRAPGIISTIPQKIAIANKSFVPEEIWNDEHPLPTKFCVKSSKISRLPLYLNTNKGVL